MEKEQNNFNEIEYLVDVAKIRHEIIKLMKKNNIINPELQGDNMVVPSEIDQYFGKIAKTGAVGVEFAYGYPVSLFTAFGRVRTGLSYPAENRGDYVNQENLYRDMESEFGIVEVEPKFTHKMMGEFGPYCTITSLPWKKNEKLPNTFKRVTNEDPKSYAVKKETERANEILAQAIATVEKLGVNNKKSKCVIGKQKAKTAESEIGDEVGLE